MRERAASYLRDHLGLDAIQPYLELYDLALDMQSEAPAPLLAERGASVAAGLGRQASRQEQVSVLAALIVPVKDRADAAMISRGCRVTPSGEGWQLSFTRQNRRISLTFRGTPDGLVLQ